MSGNGKSLGLKSYDDIFSTEEERQETRQERVVRLPLAELHYFKNHPFKVKDDEQMAETAESVKDYGVLVPGLVRPDPAGGYEIVSGHRRHRASELAGIKVTRYDGAQFERICKFLDECHTSINGECYHICQWAEIMERNGNKYEAMDYITDPDFYPKRYLTPADMSIRPPYFVLDTTREYGFGYSPGSKREYRYCIFDLTPEKRRGDFTVGPFRQFGSSLKDLRPKDYGFNTEKIKAVVVRKPKARNEPER